MDRSSEKGQASLLVGMIMTTLILLFFFVVNTGVLVNAKINLQNAADMAAYAGAATQARQLNQISFLNYEMRRQYKKFLFRYYVLGGFAQKSFSDTSGPRKWSPDGDPANDMKVPVVCILFDASENFCQVFKLASSPIPSGAHYDQVGNALKGLVQTIEVGRQQNCQKIGKNNLQILNYWLWNADPDFKNSAQNATDPEVKKTIQIVQGVASGLGLIPREMLLKKRIDTLQYYVNFPPQSGLNLEGVNALQGPGVDAARHERAIQAFLSAYHTLGNHAFPGGNVQMDEMLPTAGGKGNLLKLNAIQTAFDVYALDMELVKKGTETPLATDQTDMSGADCIGKPIPYSVSALPIGVYKDPIVATYYAVRLQASAKLMFSPFGNLRLSAYAAARPFGSRIGPKLTAGDFRRPAVGVRAGGTPVCDDIFLGKECARAVPNLPLTEQDGSGESGVPNGWNDNAVIHAFFQTLGQQGANNNANGGEVPSVITAPLMEQSYHLAMVPNPWEEGKYNIPADFSERGGDETDPGADPFVDLFDQNTGEYAFWAPLHSTDSDGESGGSIEDELNDMVNQMIRFPGNLSGSFNKNEFKKLILDAMRGYVARLRQGNGELGEGFSVVRIQNPVRTRESPPRVISGLDPKYFLSEPLRVKTSWNTARDAEFASRGRIGYSVKFVPLRTLTGDGSADISMDGNEPLQNAMPIGPDAAQELGGDQLSIEH